ncbi:hypothetical protein Kpol_363p8 [Vanderwaltozyma polyspora DSM 70294]|uniref:EXS domain-containing protein n=1 Tax=Vanderwaltozyma polyspora (strain ATCC 22028 / DSM 70294 / BCRC 21397 / CBS 2163 / NBRC 10782 / NRRL Y-8283 / UCD 57-17) TaxID=436907 RepID=A7TS91_VANPO|nr:uncharacterized protein Kpol_363p8 [Vanderwaltozyma polyspora DSM 70294]EDO14868.1 hypothetical protein Kpol_363p8 [Vanderwaltozyma polyspora DSM 70294]
MVSTEEILKFDSIAVPIPQRLNLLILLAVWVWQWILHVISSKLMDISHLVITRKPGDIRVSYSHGQVYKASRQLAVRMLMIIFPLHVATMTFWYIKENSDGSSQLSNGFMWIGDMLPLIQFVIIISMILKNSPVVFYCCKRLLLIESQPRPLRTTYILISDTLTSFSKPLIDFTLYLSILAFGELKFSHIDLLVALFPVFIRMFQCLREFRANPKDKMLFYNMLKYASSLPILVCMWLLRSYPHSSHYHTKFQKFFMLIQSCYTFYWDLFNDWSLNSIKNIRVGKSVTFPKEYYRVSVLFDFIVRFWWVWISLGHYLGFNFTTAMLFDGEIQYLEIIRRGIWVIFRLESDYISINAEK